MIKASEIDLTLQAYHLLRVAGFDVLYESVVTRRHYPKLRLLVRCPSNGPLGLIEVCLPDTDGIITPSKPITLMQAVPYYALSSPKDVSTVVSLFQ